VYNAVSGIERGSDRHAGEIYAKTSKGYEIRSTFETKTDLTQTLSRMVNS
jgi:hypothetical protein